MPYLIIPLVSFLAGMTNAIAGGGTFFTFPALTGLAGLTERAANITSTIGLWPGAAASVWSARTELKRLPLRMAIAFSIISVIGAIVGAVLLLVTPQRTFRLLVPWLLLFATAIFGFSKPIARWAGRQHGHRTMGWTIVVGGVQLLVAIYGGYFGAGIGILMLAGLAFAGLDDIHQMNAMKVLLQTDEDFKVASRSDLASAIETLRSQIRVDGVGNVLCSEFLCRCWAWQRAWVSVWDGCG